MVRSCVAKHQANKNVKISGFEAEQLIMAFIK